ncbi:glycosyltransferase family 2 protein [Haloarcula sp. CBA1131]|uniref:glycosyltransferase family 2 protein n=1 Tax=Haloarcula sp. CBA1131 TaxID=1853686 RepID=UPI001245685D|nr:glycosyltransferase family 2 protein [Haloarcula sp. CBA1131]KAA9407018.1 glycosyltransferase family 2 protein [Haloarcula sp. CBA1131]
MEKVSAVILNWNNYEDTTNCLNSLKSVSYPNLDIIVVDNGSTDGSAESLKDDFPDVELIQLGENRGFGGGMNIGIEQALSNGSEYIWVLNNDVIIEQNSVLKELVDSLKKDASIGVVSPVIYSYPDTEEIWFWKGSIDWNTGEGYHPTPPDHVPKKNIQNDYVPLCCALFPAEIFSDVGFLPEKYFLYYEDVDYSVQLAESGYDLVTLTDTTIFHKRGGSSGNRLGPISSYYLARNQRILIREFNEKMSPFHLLWYFKVILKETTLRIYNWRIDGLFSLYRGITDGLRNKTGKGPYP